MTQNEFIAKYSDKKDQIFWTINSLSRGADFLVGPNEKWLLDQVIELKVDLGDTVLTEVDVENIRNNLDRDFTAHTFDEMLAEL